MLDIVEWSVLLSGQLFKVDVLQSSPNLLRRLCREQVDDKLCHSDCTGEKGTSQWSNNSCCGGGDDLEKVTNGTSVTGDTASVIDADGGTPYNSSADRSRLLVLIPGNPGLVHPYREFARELSKSGFDTLVIGLVGQSLSKHNNHKLHFRVSDQIQAVDQLLTSILDASVDQGNRSEVPRGIYARYSGGIYLAGHSIGAYIAVHTLHRHTGIKRFFGLCPVLSEIKKSPRGRNLSRWVGTTVGRALAVGCAAALDHLPQRARECLIGSAFNDASAELKGELCAGLHRGLVANILHLAADEFRTVKELDCSVVHSVQEKLFLYFVATDGWCPLTRAQEIADACPRLGKMTVEKDASVPHAWCMQHSKTVIENAILPYL